jgi:hypothetical protein
LAQRPAVARINERPTAERDDAPNAELSGNVACRWSNFVERRNSRALADAEALFTFALEETPVLAMMLRSRSRSGTLSVVARRRPSELFPTPGRPTSARLLRRVAISV